MGTHAGTSHAKHIFRLPSMHKAPARGLALAVIFMLVLVALTLVFTVPERGAQPASSRAQAAYAARYQGQADMAIRQAASVQRANAAYAARLQGRALLETARSERINAAYTARLQGLADLYAQGK